MRKWVVIGESLSARGLAARAEQQLAFRPIIVDEKTHISSVPAVLGWNDAGAESSATTIVVAVSVSSNSFDLLRATLAAAPQAIVVITATSGRSTIEAALSAGASPTRVVGVGLSGLCGELRSAVAARLRVTPEVVQVSVAGSPESGIIPLWSSATVCGVPTHLWAVPGHGRMTVRERTEIFEPLREAFVARSSGRGGDESDAAADADATMRLLSALTNDAATALCVEGVRESYMEVGPTCVCVPTLISAQGAGPVVPTPLNPAEQAGLKEIAVRSVMSAGQ
jgi:L-lactate dehydrogenase